MITPETILPSVTQSGHLSTPEQLFANYRLDEDELTCLQALAIRMQPMTEQFGGAIGLGREHLPENMPWLNEWALQMDSWVDSNGLLLPVPLANDEQGRLEIIVHVGLPTPDHVDTFQHMPIGLSIGVQGLRELVSVGFDSDEEAFEAQAKLRHEGRQLADLEEFEGREVQRVTQGLGDVTQIASYATLHSGRPLESLHDDGFPLDNAVVIIGYVSTVAASAEDIAHAHMDKFYRPSEDSLRNRLSGGDIVTSIY